MADENEESERLEMEYTRLDGSSDLYYFSDVLAREKIKELEQFSGDIINDETPSTESAYSSEKVESLISQSTSNSKSYADDLRKLSKDSIDSIESKIPEQASAENQLADKNFVNSTVATETSNFKGTYQTLEELQAVSPVTNNDYGYVVTKDSDGNTIYKRYKYASKTKEWLWEYDLNNSSFTAEEWAAIKSGITADKVSNYNQAVTDSLSNKDTLETLTGDKTVTGSIDNKIDSEFNKRAILSHWFGTQSQYDALEEKENGVLYFIKRDE